MSMQHLLTIGYEGTDQPTFLATLRALGVTLVLDVRELAMSRRPGFAKTALREGLAGINVGYRHEPRLGSPKPLRDRLHQDHDYSSFFEHFECYLKTQEELIKRIAAELSGTVVLLCYERDYTTCHRKAVGEALQKITGVVPVHHTVKARAVQPSNQQAWSF